MRYDVHPETLKLIAEKLTEVAQRELGFKVRFEWPDATEVHPKMTMIVCIDQPMTPELRTKLRAWCEKNLDAEWPVQTFWDRIREESV